MSPGWTAFFENMFLLLVGPLLGTAAWCGGVALVSLSGMVGRVNGGSLRVKPNERFSVGWRVAVGPIFFWKVLCYPQSLQHY